MPVVELRLVLILAMPPIMSNCWSDGWRWTCWTKEQKIVVHWKSVNSWNCWAHRSSPPQPGCLLCGIIALTSTLDDAQIFADVVRTDLDQKERASENCNSPPFSRRSRIPGKPRAAALITGRSCLRHLPAVPKMRNLFRQSLRNI